MASGYSRWHERFVDAANAGLVADPQDVSTQPRLVYKPVAVTGPTSTGTLSAAQQIAEILTCDLGGAATLTTRTGTQIEAAFDNIRTGEGFYQTIINTSAEDGRIVTLAGGTGVTISGRATIDAADAPATNPESSATFFYQRTAANTFIAYRTT